VNYRLVIQVAGFFLGAVVLAQDQPGALDEEMERLTKQYKAETDPAKQNQLNEQIGVLFTKQAKLKCTELHELWRRETDVAKRKDLAEELCDAAVHSEQPDIVVEVATNGTFAEKEIKIEGDAKRVVLQTVRSFDPERGQWSDVAAWVVRRMTKDRLELWLPHHGWLFDGNGKIINEAKPPRRDGLGREWYGAFLPNGRWVTTDLWEMDRTLSFFSRGGKYEREIAADKLVPRGADDEEQPSLIGWCRSDRDGKGFVLSVGANGGRGVAWVNWGGEHRILKEGEDPWKLCFPRDLEPKGMYVSLSIPSDDGGDTLLRTEPSHGMLVGFPTYQCSKVRVMVPDGETFGFWPASHDVYIITKSYLGGESSPEGETPQREIERTWFYNANGEFIGWIAGRRLADTEHSDGMLFRDPLNHIVALDSSLHATNVRQFVWRDGATAAPYKLFPDLRLGFFNSGTKLVLARWHE
jgi:hypothetical protein